MTTLYGIPNCNTIKKAKDWLNNQQIDFDFFNYKKQDITKALLKKWIKQVGWEGLLNKKGMTWRKLDVQQKENVDETKAMQIMLDNPSIIKRPILEANKQILVGFIEEDYQQLFSTK